MACPRRFPVVDTGDKPWRRCEIDARREGGKAFPPALKAWTTLRVAHPTAPSLLRLRKSPETQGRDGHVRGREGAKRGRLAQAAATQLDGIPAREHAVGRSVAYGPAGRARSPQEAAFMGLATHPPPGRGFRLSGPISGVPALSASPDAPSREALRGPAARGELASPRPRPCLTCKGSSGGGSG